MFSGMDARGDCAAWLSKCRGPRGVSPLAARHHVAIASPHPLQLLKAQRPAAASAETAEQPVGEGTAAEGEPAKASARPGRGVWPRRRQQQETACRPCDLHPTLSSHAPPALQKASQSKQLTGLARVIARLEQQLGVRSSGGGGGTGASVVMDGRHVPRPARVSRPMRCSVPVALADGQGGLVRQRG